MAPLWELCMGGKLAEARAALARGEDVNSKVSIGRTALMAAVFKKHNSIVTLLLDQPAVECEKIIVVGLRSIMQRVTTIQKEQGYSCCTTTSTPPMWLHRPDVGCGKKKGGSLARAC